MNYYKMNYSEKITSNQKKFMLYMAILPEQAFINGILVLFYITQLNISMSEYLFLDGTLFLITAIFEIPSGFLSDYFGRKRMLIFSQCLVALSMIILLVANHFLLGIISVIFLGVGLSLGSGNSEAILYEYFLENDNIHTYEKILSNRNSIFSISSIVYGVVSGFIFSRYRYLILILDIIIIILNIIITHSFLYDPEPKGVCKATKRSSFREYNPQLKEVFKVVPNFLLIAILFSLFRVSYNFYQPLYKELSIPVEVIGFFPMVYQLLNAIGAQIYGRLLSKTDDDNKKLFCIEISIVMTLLLVFWIGGLTYMPIIIILIHQVIRGIFSTYSSVAVNRQIPSQTEYRTAYISFFRTIMTFTGVVFILIGGLMAEYLELKKSFFSLLMIMVFFAILLHTMIFLKSSKS